MPKRVFPVFRAGKLPEIELKADQRAELHRILRDAGASQSTCLDNLLNGAGSVEQVVVGALTNLAFAKVYSFSIPRLRAMVSGNAANNNLRSNTALRRAMEKLVALIPDVDVMPPWAQMREEYTTSADGTDEARRDEWDQRLHPRMIKQALKDSLSIMDRLNKKVAGTKPFQVPERRFVEVLADFWLNDCDLPLTVSRVSGTLKGPFADFVRAAQDAYPRNLRTFYESSRHADLVLGSLDGHIRDVVDEKRGRGYGNSDDRTHLQRKMRRVSAAQKKQQKKLPR